MPCLGPKKVSQTCCWFYRNVFQKSDLLDLLVSSDFDRSWLNQIPVRCYPTWARDRSVDRDGFKLYVTRYARDMVNEFSHPPGTVRSS